MSLVLRIGLTGGTGAGKSTVARLLAGHGAVVVDADVLAREVLAPGSPGLAAVATEFGTGVLGPDGALDRAALAAAAFATDERRRALEAITHPRIAERTRELFTAAPADAIVVHDVPLLVEKGMGPAYHLVVVVDADVETRVSRLAARGMSVTDARARIRAQATREQRLAAADVWLDNDGGDAELAAAVERLWRERLVPYERHVRSSTTVAVTEEPLAQAQTERLVARLRLAAGGRALDVRPVGPAARLELEVASRQDARALAVPLADAGFPLLDDIPTDRGLLARHGSADPGRPVLVEVLERAGRR